MPIPKFHEVMLPLLQLYSDNQAHHRKDFVEQISDCFKLTDLERQEKVKSGGTRIWDRIMWAGAFLKSSSLIESERRGYHKITNRGREVLKLGLKTLTVEKIKELYPDVMETKFWNPELREKTQSTTSTNLVEIESESTPDESLDVILSQKEAIVKSEILESINNLNPRQFEILVLKVLISMGYGTSEFSKSTAYTNDGGIDGIIQADELGFDKIYIQAKKYEGNVGRPDMQKFVGAMTGTNKGVFITTSDFAPSVDEYLKSRSENVQKINGEMLVDLMYKHNQGVSIIQTIEIKRLDSDYFEEL
jgi:restriction system protein